MYIDQRTWDLVQLARMLARDSGLHSSEAFVDGEGRVLFDALPSERDAYPVTFAVRAIQEAA